MKALAALSGCLALLIWAAVAIGVALLILWGMPVGETAEALVDAVLNAIVDRGLQPLGFSEQLPTPSGPTPTPIRTTADTAPPPQFYVVMPGDTLYEIAWRLGRTALDIARDNDLDDPAYIVPGQALWVGG